MIKVYNADDSIYGTLEDYLQALEDAEGEELETTYRLVYMYSLATLFDEVKRRTARRGKHIRTENEEPMIEKVAMTNEEETEFNNLIYDAAIRVFSVLAGYARNIDDAFKFTDSEIGDITYSGSGNDDMSVDKNYINYTNIPDKTFRVRIDIKSNPDTFRWSDDDGETWEKEATPITGDWQRLGNTGLVVKFNAITGHELDDQWSFECTAAKIIYHLELDQYMDTNLAEILDRPIKKALIYYVVKEWYEEIGSPDMVMEERKYLDMMQEIITRSLHLDTNVKRPVSLF